MFRRKYTDSSYSFILAYVDDLLVLAETASEKNNIVKELQQAQGGLVESTICGGEDGTNPGSGGCCLANL